MMLNIESLPAALAITDVLSFHVSTSLPITQMPPKRGENLGQAI